LSDQDTHNDEPYHQEHKARPWAALRYRDYRILWMSGIFQVITMELRLLATGVWLYQETGSGIQLGLLGGVQLAVQLPAILYGGALADKWDRRKLMSYTQIISLFMISLVTLLEFNDSLRPWHIYGVTAVLGVTSVLGGPARSALTANVVPKNHLMHAVATNTATFQIGSVVAPLGFALIVSTVDITLAFVVASVASIPSVILPLLIVVPDMKLAKEGKGSVIASIKEGFLFVKAHPILPGLYAMDIGVTIFSFYRQILPLIADKMFMAGSAAVGLLTASNALGGILGTFSVLLMTQFRSKGMLVVYATLAYVVLLVLFGLTSTLWVGVVIIFALGATDAIGMATRQATVQLTTTDEMRGRAVSFHSVSAMTANNIGTLEVGFMSEKIGASETMMLGGVIGILVVAIVWRSVRGIREYRYP